MHKTESFMAILVKGIAFLFLALLIAYCLVAIAAGDGYKSLIELIYD